MLREADKETLHPKRSTLNNNIKDGWLEIKARIAIPELRNAKTMDRLPSLFFGLINPRNEGTVLNSTPNIINIGNNNHV